MKFVICRRVSYLVSRDDICDFGQNRRTKETISAENSRVGSADVRTNVLFSLILTLSVLVTILCDL